MEVNKQSIEEMHGTKLFEGLSIGELTALYKLASMEVREPGETVLDEGESGDRFYWVKSGRLDVQLHKIKNDPKPLVLNSIKAGEIFGEMILLGKSRRTASIVVRNPSSLLAWKHDDCLAHFEKNASVGYRVMSNLARIIGERLMDMNLQLRNHTELLGSGLAKYF